MSDARYTIHRNPCWPPLSNDINQLLNQHDPELLLGYTFQEPTVEYLLEHLTFDPSWPQPVQAWYIAITSWIPTEALVWWEGQFDEKSALSPMPRAWWLYRARSIVVAWDENKPIGAVALTHVYGRDRSKYLAQHEPLFNEVRGLVVESSYRTTGVGIRLMEAVVREAYNTSYVATFAVTTNPLAAKIFAAIGASETSPYPIADYAMRSLVCWEWLMPGIPLCTDCPRRPGQLWWWPTHLSNPDGS